MSARELSFSITKGRTFRFRVSLTVCGVRMSLDGWKALLHVKSRTKKSDAVIAELSTENGLITETAIDENTNGLLVDFAPELFMQTDERSAVYELVVFSTETNEIYPILTGIIELKKGVISGNVG